jgi:hypothetical protein
MAKVNTGKASTTLALTPSVERQRIQVKPNGNTVIVERNKSVVPTTTTKEAVQYDDAGKPTGVLVTTTMVKDRTIPVERTVINQNGKVVKHKVQVKTGKNVKVTTALNPYSSPDYSTETPTTVVDTGSPTQGQQVICYPAIDDNGQIVPPVDNTGTTYQNVGTVASTANGSIIAQTWRAPRDGYVTSIKVKVSDLGTAGALTAMLCGTQATGEPDMSNVYSLKTTNFADLLTGWFTVITEPVLVQKGTLYSLVLESTGAHTFETAVGGNFSQGTYFDCQDNSWFRGVQDVDLGMRVYYAEFTNTQVTTTMEPLSLENGIGSAAFRLFELKPEGTDRVIQAQVDGIWTDLTADTEAFPFTGLPAQRLMRQVLSGTKDLMPATNHDISRSIAYRKRTDFVGVSKLITAGASVTSATVKITMHGYVEADHDCVIKLMKADNTQITAAAVADTATDDPNIIERTATFTFSALTQFRVRLEGATNSALSTFGVSEILYSAD